MPVELSDMPVELSDRTRVQGAKENLPPPDELVEEKRTWYVFCKENTPFRHAFDRQEWHCSCSRDFLLYMRPVVASHRKKRKRPTGTEAMQDSRSKQSTYKPSPQTRMGGDKGEATEQIRKGMEDKAVAKATKTAETVFLGNKEKSLIKDYIG
jgi:hypothetical protein